jgi:tetratricopeptide (TPR) repeat protein
MGQAEYLKSYFDEAQGSYKKGLSFNNIHFKCLVGLYDIFMKDNQFEEAYNVIKKVAKYFPANPDRLTQIVRLAIKTQHYQDMQFYYEIFTSLEERTSVLINYIGSGMYISGKHALLNDDANSAMQYFDNIAVSCSEFTKFIRAVITILVEYDKAPEAEKFLSRFPPGAKEHEDYMVSSFLINTKQRGIDKSLLVKRGLDVYNKKIRDFDCMMAMIDAMIECGYTEDKVAPFREELLKLWPDHFAAATRAA